MKSVSLTLDNCKSVTRLVALIDWTPDELANHLLAETLEMFANKNSGALEGFLGAIYHLDRASAQRAMDRVTELIRASFNGRLPEAFRGEIFEYPDGKFDIRAEYTDGMASCNGFAERTDGDFSDSESLCHGSNPCEAATSPTKTYRSLEECKKEHTCQILRAYPKGDGYVQTKDFLPGTLEGSNLPDRIIFDTNLHSVYPQLPIQIQ
jgi:hypothetical protein